MLRNIDDVQMTDTTITQTTEVMVGGNANKQTERRAKRQG